jgi:predicted PurR-regulated permease PerM
MTSAPPPPLNDVRAGQTARVFLTLGIVALSLALLTFFLRIAQSAPRVVVILIGATMLVYLVAPLVALLRRVMPKHFAVLVTFVGLLAIIVGLVAVVFPPLISQGQQFAVALPQATLRAQSAIADPDNEFFRNFPASLRAELAQAPRRFFTLITRYGVALGRQGFTAILSAVSLFLLFIIVPVLAAYMLFDYVELERGIVGFLSERHRPRAIAVIQDLSDVMGAFVRGQVLDGLCVGTMIWLWLTIMHVPFALVIAAAAAAFNLIPYAGAIAGFIPSVLLALAYNGWENAVVVAIGFAVIQQIDGDFIVPRIMNASVKLSPVIIIVSIISFGSLFGILGALVAVPVAAMFRVFKLHFAPSPSPVEFEREKVAAQSMTQFKSRS